MSGLAVSIVTNGPPRGGKVVTWTVQHICEKLRCEVLGPNPDPNPNRNRYRYRNRNLWRALSSVS